MTWQERRQRERERAAAHQARREASVLRRVSRRGVTVGELHDRLILASALTGGSTQDVTLRALRNLADRHEVHERDGVWYPGPGPTPPQGSRVGAPAPGGGERTSSPDPGSTAGPTLSEGPSESVQRTPASAGPAGTAEEPSAGVRPTSPAAPTAGDTPPSCGEQDPSLPETPMSRPSLGARLRERRAARGINQYQAGAEIGIGQTAVSRTERGGAVHPATVARVEQWLAQPTPPPVEVAVQAPDALSPPSPPDPPRDGTEDAAASGGDLPRRSAVPELVDATPLRPAAPAVDDAAEWHDGPLYPGQLVRDVRALADERDALRLERDSLRAQNLGWRRHNDALATFLGAEPGQDDEVLRIAAAIHREAQGETGDDAAEVNWPRERHEEILDLLRQAHGGELPAWARAADLVYLHDQAQHPTRPAPVPGRRELQTRWGVSERETKASLADEAWRSKAAAAKVRVVAREAQGETGDDAAEVMASVIRGRTDAFEDRDAALEGLASVLGEDVAAPLVPREVDAARRRIREPLEAALGSGELVRGLTLPGLADEAERVIGELRTTADRYLASNRLLEAELTGHRERPPTLFVATDFGCSASPDVLALLEELGERASRSGLRVPRRGGPAGLLAYLIGWLEAHGVITAPSPEAP